MRLDGLIKDLIITKIEGPTTVDISGISFSSQEVLPGHLFVAIRGFRQDGHSFVPEAVSKGARAVLVQSWQEGLKSRSRFVDQRSSQISHHVLGDVIKLIQIESGITAHSQYLSAMRAYHDDCAPFGSIRLHYLFQLLIREKLDVLVQSEVDITTIDGMFPGRIGPRDKPSMG
ncbi:UDP-N-acetylmuramoyl-L-alanyl-D-glutamate--2,6-diaminopimelate ligase, partial [Candidatus Hakubella thermalkaliphila]